MALLSRLLQAFRALLDVNSRAAIELDLTDKIFLRPRFACWLTSKQLTWFRGRLSPTPAITPTRVLATKTSPSRQI